MLVNHSYFMIDDVFMNFALSFYNKNEGLTSHQLVMLFDRADLEKLLCYLRFITGEIGANDKMVRKMIKTGEMYECKRK